MKLAIYEYVSFTTGEGILACLGSYRLDKREDGADIQEYLYQKTGQLTVPNVFVSECLANPRYFFH